MKLYKVKGNSMYPFIVDNDTVIGKEVPFSTLRKGNIVIFRSEKGYIIHRVTGRDRAGMLYTKGDGYGLTAEKVRGENVLGRVIAIKRNGKIIPLSISREYYSWMAARLKTFLKMLVFRYKRDFK